MLFVRNRATNAFPLVLGLFLASTGTSRRVIDTFHQMGLGIGYDAIQTALSGLTKDALLRAREFIAQSDRLWGVVFDNINFTLRPTAQRLDSATRQLNATTIAVFSLPARFTRKAYGAALSVLDRNRRRGLRKNLTMQSLLPSEETQAAATAAFKHAVRTIILGHCPGHIQKRRKTRKIRKMVKSLKPRIRPIGHSKTEFFPLPALDEEEASVGGTIRVVEKIFGKLLALAEELIDTELRLMVGDWLTIRNLRLLSEERKYEFSGFLRFEWIQEVAMPFHFQLNAMYALFRTHLGTSAEALSNPSSLEHHRNLLRRSKLDIKKPEYNKAKELAMHSLNARILDCLRIVLKLDTYEQLSLWAPTPDEFEAAVSAIIERFATSAAAEDALRLGDEVMAHSILFIRDALFFWEFCDAVRDADVGRMWVVYDFWIFMMRGAGCSNYGNELLEMKAQFEHEFPPLLREVVERTWLVNRWGRKGRSIPTDLYLEHNNGFLKNMFAALGSSASMDFIQEKSSACVEVLRQFSHQMAQWFGKKDLHRRHSEVNAKADIAALSLDLAKQNVHKPTPDRSILTSQSSSKKKKSTVAVRDVLAHGMHLLVEKGQFDQWQKKTTVAEEEEVALDEVLEQGEDIQPAFSQPEGRLDVDTNADAEFVDDNPFSALLG
ncbi:hypothetical protein BKA70DRAFT_1219213 [Coprinopsis sp. MPI-PUGE-AT-0042]|nr:hypothetical protein BKA70DRAFT_1219213 [Coprinopsis sp. MPI-PUGE-AT-0042]